MPECDLGACRHVWQGNMIPQTWVGQRENVDFGPPKNAASVCRNGGSSKKKHEHILL